MTYSNLHSIPYEIRGEEKDICYFSIPLEADTEEHLSRVITSGMRYRILKRQHWRCNCCYELLKFSRKSKFGAVVAHIDHIHPYSLRETYIHGSENINELSNLQALCPKCNLLLSDRRIK